MEIRKANKKDLKDIAKLMLDEFSKSPFNEKDSLKNVLKSLNFYLKKAQIFIIPNKEILGVLVFQIERWQERKVIIVQDLAIKEKSKKNNLGKKLMNYLEKYAYDEKIKRIYIETNKKSPSINFYKKLGYKINKDRISMSKNIR